MNPIKKPQKEDFEVFDKLGNDGGAYKLIEANRWYNDEMYQEALIDWKNQTLLT